VFQTLRDHVSTSLMLEQSLPSVLQLKRIHDFSKHGSHKRSQKCNRRRHPAFRASILCNMTNYPSARERSLQLGAAENIRTHIKRKAIIRGRFYRHQTIHEKSKPGHAIDKRNRILCVLMHRRRILIQVRPDFRAASITLSIVVGKTGIRRACKSDSEN